MLTVELKKYSTGKPIPIELKEIYFEGQLENISERTTIDKSAFDLGGATNSVAHDFVFLIIHLQ